ncbi:MAG: hypothetical protein QM791_13375 [Ferruginibacter sp.]
MQQHYSFLLNNPGLRQYRRIAYIITVLNFLFFSWQVFLAQQPLNTLAGKLFLFLIALSFLFEWLYKKITHSDQYAFIINYLVLAMGWVFITPNILMLLLHLLLAAMDMIARQKIYLLVGKDGISQSQWKFKKIYPWKDFNNVVLKDALLTLDFKNNKIRYCEIKEPVDEAVFNEFCSQQLS